LEQAKISADKGLKAEVDVQLASPTRSDARVRRIAAH